MRAYDREYLFDAMETLGEAFDCAANRAGIPVQQFFDLFVSTGVADAFGTGSPKYVAGASGAELLLDVCYRAGMDVGIPLVDLLSCGDGAEYWCGWSLAFWQWSTGRPFRNIAQLMPMDELMALYHPLHEAAEEKLVEVVESRVGTLPAPLKRIREERGLSQAALAERSGVSLRSVQQYEQRQKNINHSQGQALYRLSVVLGCRIEDLLEYPIDGNGKEKA